MRNSFSPIVIKIPITSYHSQTRSNGFLQSFWKLYLTTWFFSIFGFFDDWHGMAWVTQLECPKGAEDKVNRPEGALEFEKATSSRRHEEKVSCNWHKPLCLHWLHFYHMYADSFFSMNKSKCATLWERIRMWNDASPLSGTKELSSHKYLAWFYHFAK